MTCRSVYRCDRCKLWMPRVEKSIKIREEGCLNVRYYHLDCLDRIEQAYGDPRWDWSGVL